MSDEQIKEHIKEMFHKIAKDRSGTIDKTELHTVMCAIGQNPTDENIKTMLNDVDKKGNGVIELEQFMTEMLKYMKNTNADEELLNAFRVFDKKGKGHVKFEKLRDELVKSGNLPKDEVEKILKKGDTNNDGKIEYKAFVKMLNDPVK